MPVDTSKDRFTVAVGVDNDEAARQALSGQLTDWTTLASGPRTAEQAPNLRPT